MKLTEFQKEVVQAILQLHRQGLYNVLGNIAETVFPAEEIHRVSIENPIEAQMEFSNALLLRMQETSGMYADQIVLKWYSIYLLFEFLSANSLIAFVQAPKVDSFGPLPPATNNIRYSQIDPKLQSFWNQQSTLRILPTPALFDFVDQGYMLDDEYHKKEEVRHRDNALKLSYLAVFVSILSLSLTGFGQFCNKTSKIEIMNEKIPIQLPQAEQQ